MLLLPSLVEAMSDVETSVGWCASLFTRVSSPPLVQLIADVTQAVFGTLSSSSSSSSFSSPSDLLLTEAMVNKCLEGLKIAGGEDGLTLRIQSALTTNAHGLASHVTRALEEMAALKTRQTAASATTDSKYGEMVAGDAIA